MFRCVYVLPATKYPFTCTDRFDSADPDFSSRLYGNLTGPTDHHPDYPFVVHLPPRGYGVAGGRLEVGAGGEVAGGGRRGWQFTGHV